MRYKSKLASADPIIRDRNNTRGVDASKAVAAPFGGEGQDGLILGWKRLIESFVKELGGLWVTDVAVSVKESRGIKRSVGIDLAKWRLVFDRVNGSGMFLGNCRGPSSVN